MLRVTRDVQARYVQSTAKIGARVNFPLYGRDFRWVERQQSGAERGEVNSGECIIICGCARCPRNENHVKFV